MKSPWKYLVELASLGRAAKEPERALETTTDKPDTPPEAPADAPQTPSLPDRAIAEPMVAASNETANNLDDEITDAVAARAKQTEESVNLSIAALLPDRARSTQPSRSNGQTRIKAKRVKNVTRDGDVPFGGENSAATPAPMTFLEEVAALDQEIMQLRRQLAAKLRSQNTHLKKMLDRYDA